MAKEVRLAFVWHMHQPDYRDPTNGVHLLPWVRLHAARGYTDIAAVTAEFPQFRQTINFSPVLIDQILDLMENPEMDYFHDVAMKPVDELNNGEKDFLLRHCFFINWDVHVKSHTRYHQLLMKRGIHIAGLGLQYVRARFTRSDFRDLVVLFCLAWFGFTLRNDPEIAALIEKEQGYTEEDKALVLLKMQGVLENVIPEHGRLSAKNTIEITCTPFYHPILPLLIDSHVRSDRHPDTPIFRYPEDARRQVRMGIELFESVFGKRPVGMWPSEGAISQKAVELIQEAGFGWIAADEALLYDKSTGTAVPPDANNNHPWLVGSPDASPLAACFRNRGMSDDIGFKYSNIKPSDAVENFVSNLEKIASGQKKEGSPALVTIVCDGENPWEHYPDGGKGFLRGLAARLESHPKIKLTTPSEYIDEYPPERAIENIGAGSWIAGNFDIWMGCEEDRSAWRVLSEARAKLDEVMPIPEDANDEIATKERHEVLKNLWVAEGSDWFWWYGEPFHTPLDYVFDILFRRRLRVSYDLMGLETPRELLVPIDPKLPVDNIHVEEPLDVIRPEIDGKITTFYEWSGAGHLRASALEGLMATQEPGPIQDLYFSADPVNLYLRLDINREEIEDGDILVVRILKPSNINIATELYNNPEAEMRLYMLDRETGHHRIETLRSAAVDEIVELSIPVAEIGAEPRSTISLACFLMRGKKRIDRCPLFGTVSVTVPDERWLASLWRE